MPLEIFIIIDDNYQSHFPKALVCSTLLSTTVKVILDEVIFVIIQVCNKNGFIL